MKITPLSSLLWFLPGTARGFCPTTTLPVRLGTTAWRLRAGTTTADATKSEKITKEAQELLDVMALDDDKPLLVAQVAPAVRYVFVCLFVCAHIHGCDWNDLCVCE